MAAGRIKGITIEIGGNTTPLVKALASVDNAISKTQSNLRDINKALKFDPGNTELLKDKQVELSKAISETEEKLQKEKDALEQMSKTEGFDKNSEAARNLKTQIDLDTAALKELKSQAQQASSILGTQFQVAGQKIQEVGNKIKSVGDSIAGLGSSLTAKVTVPIVSAFGAAIKTTGDFDAAMSQVQAVSGASAQDLELLRDKAKEMGKTTKFSATESAEALNYMAMAGWKTEDMLNGLEGIMNLAAASGEELGTTSDIVTDALTAFGMEADESSRFADILAAAASNANTNVSMMGESFKYVAPVAGALGYSAEDMAVALGLMANSGIKADMAGTSLRNMLNRMAKPTKESAMAMERLGLELYDSEGQMYSFREIMDQLRESMSNINVSVEDYEAALDDLDAQLEDGTLSESKYNAALEELNLQTFGAEGAEKARAAAMLGGTRAMSGLLAIANASTSDYEKLTGAIDNSSQAFARLADGSVVPLSEALASGAEVVQEYNGAAEAMSNTMLQNLPGQLTILKSKVEALAISFGEILMPKMMAVVEKIQGLVDEFNSLDDTQKETIIKFAAIAAAIGPVLLVVGKLVSSVGSIVSVFGKAVSGIGSLMTSMGGLSGVFAALTGPIGIIVGVIAALTAGFAYLFTTNESFRNSILQVANTIKSNFSTALASIQPKLQALAQGFKDLMTFLAPLFQVLITMVLGVVNGIISALSPIVTIITGIIEFIKGIVVAFFALVMGDFDLFASGILTALQGLLDIIVGIVQTVLAFIQGFFQAFGVNLKAVVVNTWNNIKTTISTKIQEISTTIQTKWNAIKDWLSDTLTAIWDKFKEIFDNIKESVSEKITKVKETIVDGLESACDYIKSLPQRFWDWGSDMVQSLIDGIKSKIEAVKQAASDLASAIAGYIHFSEPDVGPLSNFHTFMPDMVNEMVKGINSSIPRLENAMNGMAGTMANNIQAGGSMTATNNVSINVYGAQGQNVQELANEIEQIISNNVIRRGVAFA